MRPKGKLLALVAMFAAIGLITATGAFTTVEAERTADVQIAGDADALLQIESNTGDDDGFSQVDDGGVFFLDLDHAANAAGVNPNAATTFGDEFTIGNQGTQTVEIGIDAAGEMPELVSFEVGPSDVNSLDGDDPVDLTEESVQFDSGETADVTIVIDTTGVDLNDFSEDNDIIETITINANQVDN